jgi:hypothetical protein
MKVLFVLAILTLPFQEIPLKSTDEFELKLDFQFKQKPVNEGPTFEAVKSERGPLPFLAAELVVLNVLEDEMRVKVVDHLGQTIAAKNLSKNNTVRFDLGYRDDLKDQVSSHQYFIHFYAKGRDIKRRIIILFDKDGTYYVNHEKRGRI